MTQKLMIGSLEAISLPDLGIKDLHARIDTGASTSSLHVDNPEIIRKQGKKYVEFDLHPDVYNLQKTIRCQARLKAMRKVKSSNGVAESRYVIGTTLQMGEQSWPIEITLTNRQDMTYLMLIGRQGMADKVLIDPSQEHLLNQP